MKKVITILWVAVACCSQAALIVYDGFNYAPGQDLSGNTAGGTGWATVYYGGYSPGYQQSWDSLPTSIAVVSGSLTGPGGFPAPVGNSVLLGGSVGDATRLVNNDNSSPVDMSRDGAVFYFSYLFRASSMASKELPADMEYAGVRFNTGGGGYLYVRETSRLPVLGAWSGKRYTDLTYSWGHYLQNDITYLIVGKCWNDSGNVSMAGHFFTEGDELTEPAEWIVVDTDPYDAQGYSQVEFIGKPGNTMGAQFDEFRMGTTFDSVVSEPAVVITDDWSWHHAAGVIGDNSGDKFADFSGTELVSASFTGSEGFVTLEGSSTLSFDLLWLQDQAGNSDDQAFFVCFGLDSRWSDMSSQINPVGYRLGALPVGTDTVEYFIQHKSDSWMDIVRGSIAVTGVVDTLSSSSAGSPVPVLLSWTGNNISLSMNGTEVFDSIATPFTALSQNAEPPAGTYLQLWTTSLCNKGIDNIELSSRSVSGYMAWKETWGGIDIGSETNDYDEDGLPNIFEYGLGGDPTNAADQGTSPQFCTVSGYWYVHPQLSSSDSGLKYFLELTPDLLSGVWTNTGYMVAGTNDTGETLNFVTNTIDMTDSQKFIRLRIEPQ